MTPKLFVRTATLDDLHTLVHWRRETAQWLSQVKGTDQWSVDYPRQNLVAWINAGETVMVSLAPGDDPVATITVSKDGDPKLWTAEELAVPACYIYKANVVRAHAGRGIGECLISWVKDRAAASGIGIVRIDVWSTNLALHEYYKRRGFQYVRTVPGTNSGALFVAPTQQVSNLPIVEVNSLYCPYKG